MGIGGFCDAAKVRHLSFSLIECLTVKRAYPHRKLKRFLIDCGVPEIIAEYMIDCARALSAPRMRSLMQSRFISLCKERRSGKAAGYQQTWESLLASTGRTRRTGNHATAFEVVFQPERLVGPPRRLAERSKKSMVRAGRGPPRKHNPCDLDSNLFLLRFFF